MSLRFGPVSARARILSMCIVALLVAGGCGDKPKKRLRSTQTMAADSNSSGESRKSSDTKKGDGGTAKRLPIELKSLSAGPLLETVESLKGKAILIYLWQGSESDAAPRLREVTQLHYDPTVQDAVCITVAVNAVDAAAVLKVLKKHDAAVRNYFLTAGTSDVQRQWEFAELPSFVLLDRNGERAKTFGGDVALTDLKNAINKLK